MKKLSFILGILLCAVLGLTGCIQSAPQQEQAQPTLIATSEPQAVEAEAQSTVNPKGTVTDTNEITNEAGGYYIPIPDSWIGNTSYELVEDETYIYHITQDSSESSINPIILHIGAAYDVEPTNLYLSAEVFLQMDDVKFYSVPVLDFPYTQGSADGDEYEEFISDIPLVLQNVWVIDESKWQEQINTQDVNEPQGLGIPFAPVDATINGIQLGTDKDTVLETLGVGYLEKVETYVLGATGEEVEEYIFDFGTLTFTEGIFTGANIYASVLGPRGFGIGDNVSGIIECFCYAAEYTEAGYTIYYRANEGDEDKTIVVPPSCVSYNDGESLVMTCFDNPDILQEVDMEYLRYNYMYEIQYVCTFYFDENGTVTCFAMFYGAAAE